jgi:hypothetical protein
MHDFIQNAFNTLARDNELIALKAEVANLKAKADQSKAEVAYLQSENLLVREESDRHYQLWVDRGHEIERLRKLGTEMGKNLPDTDAANRAYIDFEAGGES